MYGCMYDKYMCVYIYICIYIYTYYRIRVARKGGGKSEAGAGHRAGVLVILGLFWYTLCLFSCRRGLFWHALGLF